MQQQNIQWTAPEHREQNHSPNWFWTVAGIAIAATVGAIILDNVLLATLIVISTIALLLQSVKKPQMFTFVLQQDGIRINAMLYKYKDLDSFAVTDENILIKSKKRFMPYITIPLPEKHRDAAHELLSTHLPEEDHVEPIADKIMENLGF